MKHHLLLLVADRADGTLEPSARLCEVDLDDGSRLIWQAPTMIGTKGVWRGFGSILENKEGFVQHYIDGVLVEVGIWPDNMVPPELFPLGDPVPAVDRLEERGADDEL